MSKRFDVCVKEERDGKTYWNKVGVAFQGEKGVTVKLHLFPQTPFYLFDSEPKPDQNAGSRYGTSGAGNAAKHRGGPDDDTNLPF